MQEIHTVPAKVEAEIALLGCILLEESLLNRVADTLRPEDFYDSKNKIIYRMMLQIKGEDKALDPTSLCTFLQTENKLDDVGGYEYIASLANYGYSISNFETYIELISDASIRRQSIKLLSELTQLGYKNDVSTFDFIESVETAIFDLAKRRRVGDFKTIGEISTKVLENTERNANQKEELVGIKTGFGKFDKYTLGLQPGQLAILAARPAMGKSAMALNIACNVATKNKDGKGSVAIFSLEMPAEQLVERMIAADSKIQLNNIKTGRLLSQEWLRFNTTCSKLSKLNVFFDDSAGISVGKIRAKCRKLAVDQGLDLVVIDYLQLIEGDKEARSDQEKVSRISRGLKLMAMELNVPVIALSQLSRAVEKRDDKRPLMADLRDSGSIEQDADIVMFLYRDDYYNKSSSRKGEADLILSKNRNGSTTDNDGIPLLFNGACSCFEEKVE